MCTWLVTAEPAEGYLAEEAKYESRSVNSKFWSIGYRDYQSKVNRARRASPIRGKFSGSLLSSLTIDE